MSLESYKSLATDPVLQLTIKSIQRCQSLVKPCPTFFYEDGQAKKILNNSIPFVIYKYEYEHILSEWKLSEIDQNLALNNPSFLSLIKKYNFHIFLFNVIYDADFCRKSIIWKVLLQVAKLGDEEIIKYFLNNNIIDIIQTTICNFSEVTHLSYNLLGLLISKTGATHREEICSKIDFNCLYDEKIIHNKAFVKADLFLLKNIIDSFKLIPDKDQLFVFLTNLLFLNSMLDDDLIYWVLLCFNHSIALDPELALSIYIYSKSQNFDIYHFFQCYLSALIERSICLTSYYELILETQNFFILTEKSLSKSELSGNGDNNLFEEMRLSMYKDAFHLEELILILEKFNDSKITANFFILLRKSCHFNREDHIKYYKTLFSSLVRYSENCSFQTKIQISKYFIKLLQSESLNFIIETKEDFFYVSDLLIGCLSSDKPRFVNNILKTILFIIEQSQNGSHINFSSEIRNVFQELNIDLYLNDLERFEDDLINHQSKLILDFIYN